MPNHLAQESSPYLLQHANNPVEWYPWGNEALERARVEDKPILLSIGYSACHWCHVMAHESFEDEAIAGLMNRSFINIKVDREERPDLDSTYMAAVQAMTQRGGWPMTVFLTPDGVPFYGGTYYPPEDRLGLPGFPRVLAAVADAYSNRRDEVLRSGRALVEQLRNGPEHAPAAEARLDPRVIRDATDHLRQYFDAAHGGFGGAPKFPQPMVLEFLLQAYHRRPDPTLLEMVELTLSNMARGGMYDQLGGGFHRYSTDRVWLVPHFEKMLYDNAQLALVYLHTYQLTKRSLYRRVAEDTLDYVMREMVLPEGGFASTQDADSEGHEGQFFVWTLHDIEALLPSPAAGWFAQAYDITPAGNWEGRNILHLVADAAELAGRAGEHASAIEIGAALEDGRRRLFAERETRVKPGLDDKVLASWNGLMLKAFAEGAAVLGRSDYERVARRNAEFALQHLVQGERVLRTYRQGQAKLPGYLEDYAALADAFLTLYETTLETRWFAEAHALATALVNDFWDTSSQTFSDTGRHHEALFTRPRDVFDNATPSGTSLAAGVLARLWLFTGDASWQKLAETTIVGLQPLLSNYPLGFGRLASAASLLIGPAYEIALTGDPASAEALAFRQAVWANYLPNKVVAGANEDDDAAADLIPLLRGRGLVQGRPAAYICQGFVCQQPVLEPSALAEALRAEPSDLDVDE